MANLDDKQARAHLERLNQELTSSLERCRAILHDCRQRLAANSNDPEDEDEQAEA